MLTKEINERLTKVGPGTPMGNLMRRYWHPIATSTELNREPVMAVRILGENLALYRNEKGELGLVGQRCAHRGCSLAYGIPEDAGLRCPYHGWLYNREGQVVEMPSEPATLPVRVSGYPVQELGGLIWAYMGPLPAPELPRWDLLVFDDHVREIMITRLPVNWLQAMENSLDPMHFEHLHNRWGRYVLMRQGKPAMPIMPKHVKIDFDVFEYGIYKRRLLEGQSEDHDDWKVGHPILFPYTLTLTDLGRPALQIRVPVDDENTLHFWYFALPAQPDQLPQTEIPVSELPYHDDAGRLIIDNTKGQDMMAWITQGSISDRSTEHLVTSDKGVILYRNLLLENIEKVERGEDPLGVIRDPAKNWPMIEIHRETNTGRIAGSGLMPPKKELEVGVKV
jgi:5,5'-dehydrodivanillate O-demethylase oxygenase subunit